MSEFYDFSGQPIDIDQWMLLFENMDYRRVAVDEIGGYTISTVWLGLDHGFGYSTRPLIFESMVFGAEPGADLDCRRYASEEEARAGHAELVAEVSLLVAATR